MRTEPRIYARYQVIECTTVDNPYSVWGYDIIESDPYWTTTPPTYSKKSEVYGTSTFPCTYQTGNPEYKAAETIEYAYTAKGEGFKAWTRGYTGYYYYIDQRKSAGKQGYDSATIIVALTDMSQSGSILLTGLGENYGDMWNNNYNFNRKEYWPQDMNLVRNNDRFSEFGFLGSCDKWLDCDYSEQWNLYNFNRVMAYGWFHGLNYPTKGLEYIRQIRNTSDILEGYERQYVGLANPYILTDKDFMKNPNYWMPASLYTWNGDEFMRDIYGLNPNDWTIRNKGYNLHRGASAVTAVDQTVRETYPAKLAFEYKNVLSDDWQTLYQMKNGQVVLENGEPAVLYMPVSIDVRYNKAYSKTSCGLCIP